MNVYKRNFHKRGSRCDLHLLSEDHHETGDDIVDCTPLTEQAVLGDLSNSLEIFKELPFYEQSDERVTISNNNNMSFAVDEQHEPNSSVDKLIKKNDKRREFNFSDLLKSDKDINVWTGLPSLKVLEALAVSAQHLEQCYPKNFSMHVTDRIILTLARLKQNISFVALATLFNVSPTTVAEYFSYTIQILAKILGQLVYLPSQEEIRKNLPHCFKGEFSKVRCVLDCTEVGITSPNCLNCRISTYSSYKHKRTIKFLIGVTPAGTICFCSRGFSGKSSDKFIFNEEKFIELLTPFEDEIMVDKGFSIQKECMERGIRLHIPPFLHERYTPQEAILNESIAKARIHVERAIARIKVFGVLQKNLEASISRHIDSIMRVICGLVNLASPILRDDKF